MTSPPRRTLESQSPSETELIGRNLGGTVGPDTLITLDGPLGAGKTVLAKGIAAGLSVVSWRGSPTFGLVHRYQGRVPFFHIDAYRISSQELEDLDMEEMRMSHGVVVVEWAGNVSEALQIYRAGSRFSIHISDRGENRRRIEIQG